MNYNYVFSLFLKIQFYSHPPYHYINKMTHRQKQKQKQKPTSTVSLTSQFKIKAQQILKRQPSLYLINYVKQSTFFFNLSTFKIDDFPFLEVLLMLPFRRIEVFQQEKNQKKKQVQSTSIIKSFHQTNKFKEFLKMLNQHIKKSQTLKTLIFQRISMVERFMHLLNSGLQQTKYLKQFAMKNCQLADGHLEKIKGAISSNKSLIKLDLSMNKLCQSGAMIGKILSDHSMRRNQILWLYGIRHQQPDYDLANTGLCQINLSNNEFNDKSASEMVTFLKDDDWTRCINLKNNKIQKQGVRQFALMMKVHKVLVSLDLRQNPGLTKQFSKFIFKKLFTNLQNFKRLKKIYKTIHPQPQREQDLSGQLLGKSQKISNNILQEINSPKHEYSLLNQQKQKQNEAHNNNNYKAHFNSFKVPQTNKSIELKNKKSSMQISSRNNRNKLDLEERGSTNGKFSAKNNHNLSIPNQHHSSRKKHENSLSISKKDLTTLGSKQISNLNGHINLNQSLNMYNNKIDKHIQPLMQSQEKDYSQTECKKCHQTSLRCLRLQKQNIYLQLQIRKLKHFISKNVDISAIAQTTNKLNLTDNMNTQNNFNMNFPNQNVSSSSFQRYLSTDNDEEMILKMEHMMSELTKIMENAQLNQNTQNNISNAISNAHSFSNTIPLYDRKSQIAQLSNQINQDEDYNLNLNLNAIQSLDVGNQNQTLDEMISKVNEFQ